jgi:hypothetical protein
MFTPALIVATTASGGIPTFVMTLIGYGIAVAVIILIFRRWSARKVGAASMEEGTILTIVTLPTLPVRRQVQALQTAFGSAGSVPRNGFQRPIAVLDAEQLRLTLTGARATTFLAIPRGAIRGLELVQAKDRAMKALAIRLTITTPGGPLPLDLIPLDPRNSTTVMRPEAVPELAASLREELALPVVE